MSYTVHGLQEPDMTELDFTFSPGRPGEGEVFPGTWGSSLTTCAGWVSGESVPAHIINAEDLRRCTHLANKTPGRWASGEFQLEPLFPGQGWGWGSVGILQLLPLGDRRAEGAK